MRNLGCGCFPLVAAAMLWGGGQGLWTALQNREPTVMTCAEWIAARPSASWVRLTDCELLVDESAYETLLGASKVRKAWIPVRSPGVEGPTPVVLRTQDGEILGLLQEMIELSDAVTAHATAEQMRLQDPKYAEYLADQGAPPAPPAPDADAWATAHAGELRPVREITGLVAWGIELQSDEYEEIAALGRDILAADFVVVDDGERPSLWFSAGMSAAGTVLAVISVLSLVGRFGKSA